MNKWRRYLYLVVDNVNGTYPLRRIDASTLFYPRDGWKRPPRLQETPLPHPHLHFTPSRIKDGKGALEFFGFFGRGQKKSLLAAVDYKGFSQTYDAEDRTIHVIVSPNEPKHHNPVSLAVGEALYVMDRKPVPGSCCGFEALTFDMPKEVMGKLGWDWYWHCLKAPPFVLEPGYNNTSIQGYTVVGGFNIWISTRGIGTYSFDTDNGSWSKAGDWELPFHGRADFFPEHGIWLGFSSQGNLLYSSDLGVSMQCKPELDMIWKDPNPLEEWIPLKSHLVHLGSDKFCVARMFERVDMTIRGSIPHVERFAVFTGLVLQPSRDGKEPEMVNHISRIYRFHGITTCWVF
ncbi:hypothetical protein SETIT_5G435900v2 [Setaria italica]|uniref:F-box associated domain-containing protein n=1 Tax=Setaria italica TaxID=4555 RepID=K3XQF4_SETIT|nr:uncharacterized protein LOC101786617 [Setaria italica]RCV28849.1 hypothetical protein SETIT_5G435900v2 [Setaria italica]